MQTLFTIVAAVLIAGLGCWASAHFIPAGYPQLLAQCASVLAGFGAAFGGLRLRL